MHTSSIAHMSAALTRTPSAPGPAPRRACRARLQPSARRLCQQPAMVRGPPGLQQRQQQEQQQLEGAAVQRGTSTWCLPSAMQRPSAPSAR